MGFSSDVPGEQIPSPGEWASRVASRFSVDVIVAVIHGLRCCVSFGAFQKERPPARELATILDNGARGGRRRWTVGEWTYDYFGSYELFEAETVVAVKSSMYIGLDSFTGEVSSQCATTVSNRGEEPACSTARSSARFMQQLLERRSIGTAREQIVRRVRHLTGACHVEMVIARDGWSLPVARAEGGRAAGQLTVMLPFYVDGKPNGMLIADGCSSNVDQAVEELLMEASLASLAHTIAELEREVRRLFEATRTDEITGLPNRRAFLERLRAEAALVARSGASAAIVMLDIDLFKSVNDSLGHAEGDRVIRDVAEWISGAARISDMACRIGGDEFAILMPDTSAAEAVEAAERIRCDVMLKGKNVAPKLGRGITVSAGVATVVPGASAEDSLLSADVSLYEAKRGGRNQVMCQREAASAGLGFDVHYSDGKATTFGRAGHTGS